MSTHTQPAWNGRTDDDGRLSWALVGECAMLLGLLLLAVFA